MSESKNTREGVDKAITEHINNELSDSVMVVGWVVAVATKEVGGEHFDSNGFAHFTSESFPEYSQIGLMQTVLDDKRNTEVATGIVSMLASVFRNNEE